MTSADVVVWLMLKVLYSMSERKHFAYILMALLGPVPARKGEKYELWKLL